MAARRKGRKKGRKRSASAKFGRTAKGRIKPGYYLACDTGRVTKATGRKRGRRR